MVIQPIDPSISATIFSVDVFMRLLRAVGRPVPARRGQGSGGRR
jgi:hypothetical protein